MNLGDGTNLFLNYLMHWIFCSLEKHIDPPPPMCNFKRGQLIIEMSWISNKMNCNFSSLQGKYFKTLYLHGSVTFSLERLEIKNDLFVY